MSTQESRVAEAKQEVTSLIDEAISYKPKKVKQKEGSEEPAKKDNWEKPRANASVWSILRRAIEKNIVGNPHFEKRILDEREPYSMVKYATGVLRARWPAFEEIIEKENLEKGNVYYWLQTYFENLFKPGDSWKWFEEQIDKLCEKGDQTDHNAAKVYALSTGSKKDTLINFFVKCVRRNLIKITWDAKKARPSEENTFGGSKEYSEFQNSLFKLQELGVKENKKINKTIKVCIGSLGKLSEFYRYRYYSRSGGENFVFHDIENYFQTIGSVFQEYYAGQDKKNNDYYKFINKNYEKNISELMIYCTEIKERMTYEQEKFLLEQLDLAFQQVFTETLLRQETRGGSMYNCIETKVFEVLSKYVAESIKGRWEPFEELLIKYCETKGAKYYAKAVKQAKKEGSYA